MDNGQTYVQVEGWLRRAVRMTPHPMPRGRFPALMQQAEGLGCSRTMILEVLDEWLNYGYVRVVDPITQDIEVLPAGEDMLVPGPPKMPEEG